MGLPSSGLHANGYSLVRSLIASWDLDLTRPYQEQLHRTLGGETAAAAIEAEPEHALATLGEVLLTPTTIYAGALLRARRALRAAGHDLRGLAHVTGGGLPGNIPRVLPDGLSATIDPTAWRMPSIVSLVAALGGLDDVEVRATFNAGIGMVAVVGAGARASAIQALAEAGVPGAVVIGKVDAAGGGPRYVEGPVAWATA